MSKSYMWSIGQREAYGQLKLFSDLLFNRKWDSSYLSPRLIPLVVGPTGVGKSHLIRALAQELNMPLLRLTSSSWIVSGSRDKTTVSRINDFITTNSHGIIQIDELDKFCQSSTSDWCRHIVGEVFDLLDGIVVPSLVRSEKLRTRMLLVGTGTWQSLWAEASRGTVGFKKDPEQCTTKAINSKIQDSSVIPQELLARFNSNIIVIPPPSEDDYQRAADEMGLAKLASSLGYALKYEDAVRSSSGLRWIETQYTQLLFEAVRMMRDDLVPFAPNTCHSLDSEIPF